MIVSSSSSQAYARHNLLEPDDEPALVKRSFQQDDPGDPDTSRGARTTPAPTTVAPPTPPTPPVATAAPTPTSTSASSSAIGSALTASASAVASLSQRLPRPDYSREDVINPRGRRSPTPEPPTPEPTRLHIMVGQSAPPPPYVGERAVDAAWLEQRETALVALRTDYEAQRAQAQTQPGPWWVTTTLYASGDTGDTTTTFDEAAVRAHYIAGAVSRNVPALQTLASLYATDVAGLLRQGHVDQLVVVATGDHAINAGPAPAGLAMGDARQLAALDLYMADPQIRELIDTYGGTAPPATDPMAREQVRLLGQARFEQLGRLSNAMTHVRDLYAQAMTQAERSGQGPGWIERTYVTVTNPASVGEYGEAIPPHTTQNLVERHFDHDAFNAWYIAQPSAAQQAFASFYGASHTTVTEESSGLGTSPSVTQTTQRFANSGWVMQDGVMRREGLERLNLNDPPRLNDRSQVFFDLQAGWITPSDNVHENNTLQTVVGVFMVVVVGAGAGMWASTTFGTGSLGATVATGAVVGAATSVASGVVNDNLSLRDVLRSALSGALTAGLLHNLDVALEGTNIAIQIGARVTLQGGIQALLGGSFRDGAIAALASELANLSAAQMNTAITNALANGMTPEQAFAARSFARMFSSAVRAMGNPDDPMHAFASDWLGSVMRDAARENGPTEGVGTPPPPPAASPAGDEDSPMPAVGGANPAATVPLVDNEGLPMPGTVDTSAPPTVQAAQLAARLREQGMSPDEAAAQAMRSVGLSLPAAAPDASTNPTVEVIGQRPPPSERLPRDALGNRYETDASGNQLVTLADGGMVVLSAANAVPIAVGEGLALLGAEALSRLARLASSVAQLRDLALTPAGVGLLLIGAPGNLGSSSSRVMLTDNLRLELPQGSLYGTLYERMPGGDWYAVQGRYAVRSSEVGFEILPEELLTRPGGTSSPVPNPPGPSGTPPVVVPPAQPPATPGYVAPPPAGPNIEAYPAEQMRLDDLIIESRGLVSGTPEHRSAAWDAYQQRPNDGWDYDRWSSVYEANQTRAAEANAAADEYQRSLGWGEREVTLPVQVGGTTSDRRLDIADPRSQRGIEYKTGYQTATVDNLWELERDAALVQQGWNIEWVFRDQASQPLLDALSRAGIKYRVGG